MSIVLGNNYPKIGKFGIVHKISSQKLCKIYERNCETMINKTILINRIEELCKEKDISLNVAFVESKVGKNFKSNLNYAEPTLGKISLLADYFSVAVEYLTGESDNRGVQIEKSPAVAGLKEKHLRLITAYDRAEAPIQEAVDRLLKIDEKPIIVKIAARDGSFEEREITKEEWNKINNLPDADL